MRLKHVDLINQAFQIQKDQDVFIHDGRIVAISDADSLDSDCQDCVDLSGLLLIPGLIDIHIHGAVGEDTSDGQEVSLRRIASFLLSKGITGFCPTTMMIPDEQIRAVLRAAECMKTSEYVGAKILGVRLEGPFLSKEKCGVQNTAYAKLPSVECFQQLLQTYSADLVRIVDLAPELPGANDFISFYQDKYVISIAHTAATYRCCKEAISLGARHGTHLFNAMNPLHHHEPGAVGALLDDSETTCELICDGMHMHPTVLKIAWKLLGCERIVVVSDAMRAAGMPDGVYDLGGTPVTVHDGRTDFGNGRLAGSTTNLLDEIKYLVSIGIPLTEAVKTCSINPARVLHVENEIGSLAIGKSADMVAVDQDLCVHQVWMNGKSVYKLGERK